jgi:hypothetical protein
MKRAYPGMPRVKINVKADGWMGVLVLGEDAIELRWD